MGNINYNNLICDNYYCQSVSFKPEWFSESSWNIEYKYQNENLNNEEPKKKPYNIDKGILKIKNTPKFDLLLSKKLLLDFNEIKNISIPINFRYELENEVNISLIFSTKQLSLEDINNEQLFFINLNFTKKRIYIYRSFDNKIIKKKINSSKVNTFDINIENNFQILLITEKLYNNNIKAIYEGKYLKNFNQSEKMELYLNFFIKNKNDLTNKNEFIELNFE
jgi:hypothetical protein